MKIAQQRIILFLFGLMAVGHFLVLLSIAPRAPAIALLPLGLAAALFAGLGVAYWRGWDWARYVGAALIVPVTAFNIPTHLLVGQWTPAIFIPPMVALILVEPVWVLTSALATLAILVGRIGLGPALQDIDDIVMYGIVVGVAVLSRLSTENASRLAAVNAEAAAARAEAEEQSRRLSEANVELQRLVDETRRQASERERLLDVTDRQRATIAELSAPILPVAGDALAMPLVGVLDAARLEEAQRRALEAVAASRARRFLIDVTGLTLVDTNVARGLLALAQATRLLGTQVTLVGVRAEVAQTLVGLGVDLGTLEVSRDIQTALAR